MRVWQSAGYGFFEIVTIIKFPLLCMPLCMPLIQNVQCDKITRLTKTCNAGKSHLSASLISLSVSFFLCCTHILYIHSTCNFRLMKTFSWLVFISRSLTPMPTTKWFTLSWTVMRLSSPNPKLSFWHCGSYKNVLSVLAFGCFVVRHVIDEHTSVQF